MNFLVKIFSPVCTIISILLLIYVFYKSQIYWGDSLNDVYFYYYLIAFFLVFFSLITFFLNKTIKEYLIISTIVVIFSLYSFESYLNLNKKIPNWQDEKKMVYEQKTGKKYDTRTQVGIYKDLKKEDNKIKLAIAPLIYFYPNYQIFPLSNASNSKTIHCNENGYYSIYQSDRYGFNNPDEEWNTKEIEYLLVGDSFTHGACVNRPEDIGSVLRLLSSKSVLNLGNSANGPLIEYAVLKEYLLPNVKKVLWIFYEGSDFDDLNNELKHKTLIKYFENSDYKQNLMLRQNEIDKLVNAKIDSVTNPKYKVKNFIFLSELRKILITFFKSKKKEEDSIKKTKFELPSEFIDILKRTKDLVNENNSKLHFVFLPRISGKGYYDKEYYEDEIYLLVKKKVNELNIPFIDIKKHMLDKETNMLKFFPLETPGGHYNAKGNKKIAEIIYNFTKN